MDRIHELLGKLGDLTAEEITELRSLIDEQVDLIAAEPATAEVADTLEALAEANEQVVAEVERRNEESAAIAARRDEQLRRLRPEPAAEETPAEEQPAAEETPAEEQPAEREAVAASAQPAAAPAAQPQRRQVPGDLRRFQTRERRPENRPTPQTGTQAASLVFAADAHGYRTGADVPDRLTLARAFERTHGAMGKASAGADGSKVLVASARRDFPEDRRLTEDTEANATKIERVTNPLRPDSLVAAGGLCAPIENLYDVSVIGVTDRPLRAALPGFQATRGGVSLRGGQLFQDFDTAPGDWTLEQDEAVNFDDNATPRKHIVDVLCAEFEEFYIGATYLRLRFHNITARTDPEGTAANIAASEIAYARYAENKLLKQMAQYCTPVTGGQVLGAARDIMFQQSQIAAYMRSRHRLGSAVRLRTVMSTWVLDLLRADHLRGVIAPTIADMVTVDADITAAFEKLGMTPVWTLDGRTSAQAAGGAGSGKPAIAAQTYSGPLTAGQALPSFPSQVEQLVYTEGDFLYLDAGELDLGLVRDHDLNAANMYETFFEEFNGVAYRGTEALQVVSTLAPTGQRSADKAISA